MVRSLVRTFATVFPECTAWFVNADLFLIGSDRPLVLDFARAAIRLSEPELARALEAAGLCGPVDVLACFLLDKERVARFAGEGRILSDDLPWAEFEAPKSVEANHVPESLALLAPLAQPATAILDSATVTEDQSAALERRFESRMSDLRALQYYYGGLMISTDAAEGFLASLAIDPENCNALHYLREVLHAQAPALIGWGRAAEIEPLLLRAAQHLPGWAELQLHLADAYHAQGVHQAARQRYQRYLELGGDAPRAVERARAAH
jgi:tetratricopeptide (TPR) repeat protein